MSSKTMRHQSQARKGEAQDILDQIHDGYAALCGLFKECDKALACMTLGPRVRQRYRRLRQRTIHVLSMDIPIDGFRETPEFARRQALLADYAAIANHADVIEITDDLQAYHEMLFSTLEEVYLNLDRRLVDAKKTIGDVYQRPGIQQGSARWDARDVLAKAGFRHGTKTPVSIEL